MKKIIPLFILLLSSVFPAQRGNTPPKDKDIDCKTYNSACYTPQTGAYNAPMELGLGKPWNISVYGSFLYLQAMEDNLNYISSTSSTENGLGSGETHTRQFGELSFDYKPAFKVGVGGNFGYDQWSISADYFRFHASPSTNNFS